MDWKKLAEKLGSADYAALSVADAVARINAPTVASYADVNVGTLLRWAAKSGALAAIKNASNDPANPAYGIAIAAWIILSSGAVSSVSFENQDTRDMIAALVAAKVLTVDQGAGLLALGTVMKSEAVVEFRMSELHDGDIAYAKGLQ